MNLDLKVAQEQLLVLFEQHFFIFADPFLGTDLPELAGDYIKTAMRFSGDIDGEFIMLFPEDKSKEVISNFLGFDENDIIVNTMSHFDAASEIMNILGAHILSLWLINDGNFNIGLPETTSFNLEELATFAKNKNITGILIDGEPIFLKIVLNENVKNKSINCR